MSSVPATSAMPSVLCTGSPAAVRNSSLTALPGHRIEYIDATRGLAMCFACASHFADHYLVPSGAIRQAMFVQMLAMLASPTFMLVSGALVGYMYAVRPDRFGLFRAKLVDRGAFLLLIGHLLILIPKHIDQPLVPVHTWVFVTDVIGLSVIAVPWLVPSLSGRVRLWLGVGMYALSIVLMRVFPANDDWRILPGLLWGTPPGPNSGQLFPLIPWLSVYLLGTALGERLAHWREKGGDREVAQQLGWLSAVLITCALVTWRGVRLVGPLVASLAPGLSVVLGAGSTSIDWVSPWQKLPPAPAYLALQSGLGLSILATLAALQHSVWMKPVLAMGTALGRASLFIFVLQFYIYDIALRPIRTWYIGAWPLIWAATVALLLLAASFWNRYNLNACLTLGLQRLLSPRSRRQLAATR